MANDSTSTEGLERLESEALTAMQRGRDLDAICLWRQLLTLAPAHVEAWTELGQLQFKCGRFREALDAFRRAGQLDGGNPRRWTSVAFACQRLGDDAGEEAALFQALCAEPRDLLAQLLRGRLFERQGRAGEAAAAYGAALAVAPPPDKLAPELATAVAGAVEFRQQHERALSAHLESQLRPLLDECAGTDLERFKLSIDILAGRKRRYESQPLLYWFPRLPHVEFFDRSQFPWIEGLEAHADVIREEYLALMSGDGDFVPYIRYRSDQPLDQWAELNESKRWSAFHLIKNGATVAENVARCPKTMQALATVPAPHQRGRTPAVMFSVLQPRTHIPPHVGASNARLVAHLPLVVPPGCRFRVGNSVQEWKAGEVLVFDDTVEHEAWNDSDRPRAVLIFDLWHPALSMAERRMVSALSDALDSFGNGADGRIGSSPTV